MPDDDRTSFRSLFFGEIVSVELFGASADTTKLDVAENFGIRTRERYVPVLEDKVVSPHVVDLSPAPAVPEREPVPRRPGLGRRAAFVHAVKRLFRHPSTEEFDRMAPAQQRSGKGGNLREFLALPFLMLALPFRRLFRRKPKPAMAPVRTRTAPVASVKKTASKKKRGPRSAPAPKRRKAVPVMSAPAAWHRRLASFGAVCLAVTLPVLFLAAMAGVLDDIDFAAKRTTIALGDLQEAGADAARLNATAAAGFDDAAKNFSDTRSRLRGVTVSLGAILTGHADELRDGQHLLRAGEEAARAGALLTAAMDVLDSASERPATERVARLSSAFREALPHLKTAAGELGEVSPDDLPDDYRPDFEAATSDLTSVLDHVERFTASSDLILTMLGDEKKRRYLVLFQNDRELRPTGGFIGSYALMDVHRGEIVDMEIPAGGSYDLRGGLRERIAAPQQLRLVNARWEFQDANWFADFPTSARTLIWFYEKSGGPTVDGVITVTTTFMEDLLRVIGPVDLAAHGETLDADNFWLETQKAVEIEYDREANRPKQIISDMAPRALEKLVDVSGEELLPLVETVSTALERKHILMYFRDEGEQSLASEYGWTGELEPLPNADYLAVVDSNIAGGKTDGVVSADIRLESEYRSDGAIVNTLTVRRTHHGEKGALFTGVKNIDFMRVYVPRGSTLLSAEGFESPGEGYFLEADETLEPATMLDAVEGRRRAHEPSGTVITEESGLTVFGNWVQLEPGESKAVRLTYRLPFTSGELISGPETSWERFQDMLGAFETTARAKLVVQRQPGAKNRDLHVAMRFPKEWRVRSRIPGEAVLSGGGLDYQEQLESDLYIGALLTTK